MQRRTGHRVILAIDQQVDFGGRHRARDEIALGRGRHTHPFADLGDGADDGMGALGAFEGAHERAIDLDLVEGEAQQVAQCRIAGAEIVERDPEAERMQLAQCGWTWSTPV